MEGIIGLICGMSNHPPPENSHLLYFQAQVDFNPILTEEPKITRCISPLSLPIYSWVLRTSGIWADHPELAWPLGYSRGFPISFVRTFYANILGGPPPPCNGD